MYGLVLTILMVTSEETFTPKVSVRWAIVREATKSSRIAAPMMMALPSWSSLG